MKFDVENKYEHAKLLLSKTFDLRAYIHNICIGFCPQVQTYVKLVFGTLGLSNCSWTET